MRDHDEKNKDILVFREWLMSAIEHEEKNHKNIKKNETIIKTLCLI